MKLQRLSEPVTINSYVRPVALPSGCAPSGTMCLIAGWGETMSSTSHQGKFSYLDSIE